MSLHQELAGLPVVDAERYEKSGYPYEEWDKLRATGVPIRIESGPVPFWAVTTHADITTVGRLPNVYSSIPRLMVSVPDEDEDPTAFKPPPTVISMDPPIHREFRRVISSKFTPGALKKIVPSVERIARQIVDDLFEETKPGDEREVDFVEAVAAPLPIAVLGWLLGVPEEDWDKLYDWTNRMVGADDPDFQPESGEEDDGRQAIIELFGYFTGLLEHKKKNPNDDLLTLLLLAEVEGRRLEPLEVLAYCLALVVAGNETTRNATSAGLLALIEHPEQMRRLQNDPELLNTGVEELLRWSSPLVHFARTATETTELSGTKIEKGDALALFYPSANRDERIFEDPYRFDVGRTPNRHLAFGVGEHFCAGAHVARLELVMAFKHLLPRIQEIELAGDVARLRSSFVGGIKRLPVRYRANR